jgi:rSAM/selenodomain-associated transferase 2
MKLSIVVPVLNEAGMIEAALAALQPFRSRGHEVVVVDGGSRDGTAERAVDRCDRLVTVGRGRAVQQNAGAAAATGDILLFLHVDCRLPDGADAAVVAALSPGRGVWGRFDVALTGRHFLLPVIARAMNLRSRLTGIATGDQGIFVDRAVFGRVGGFPSIALMEDIALSARLKRESPPVCLRDRVIASGRRWEKYGVVRTILLMWRLRLAYFLGADPERLAAVYRA